MAEFEPLTGSEDREITIRHPDAEREPVTLGADEDTVDIDVTTTTTTTREQRTVTKDASVADADYNSDYGPELLLDSSSNARWDEKLENLEIKAKFDFGDDHEYVRLEVEMEDGTRKEPQPDAYDDTGWVSVGDGTIKIIDPDSNVFYDDQAKFYFRADVKVDQETTDTSVSTY